MIPGFQNCIRAAAAAFALLVVPFAGAQVLSDNFGAATLNPAMWFQDTTLANMTAPQASGQLQFRSTVNNGVPFDTLNYVATQLEPGIGTISNSQVSVKMNLTKATPAQSNYDEGLAVLFTEVEASASGPNQLPPSMVFAIGSYFDSDTGTQIRYMTLNSVDDLGALTELMYADESPAGKFKDSHSLKTVSVPATGAIPVYFSLVKGASAWTFRVGFTSFADTANAFSTTISFDDMNGRPYRPVLAGWVNGPVKAALTGSRSYFDDFAVAQGVLSYRPENLSASQGTSTTAVNLSWTAAAGATSYKVYKTSNLVTPIATVAGTSYADATPAPGVVTEYCVRAYSATAGESEHSDFVTGFKKLPLPTVTAVSPASGPLAGNTLITVTGTNFVTGATTVTVGGVAATSVSVTSATTLTARTPAGTAGAKAVAATTAGGTGTKANAFTYTSGSGLVAPPSGDGGVTPSSGAQSTASGGSAAGGARRPAGAGVGSRAAAARWSPTTGIAAVDLWLALSSGQAASMAGADCRTMDVDLDADGEPDLCQLRRGDLDLDGDVDADDAELVRSLVGRESPDGIADLDGDGWVTEADAAAARSGGATLASTPR